VPRLLGSRQQNRAIDSQGIPQIKAVDDRLSGRSTELFMDRLTAL
jgi:hypothetical protein